MSILTSPETDVNLGPGPSSNDFLLLFLTFVSVIRSYVSVTGSSVSKLRVMFEYNDHNNNVKMSGFDPVSFPFDHQVLVSRYFTRSILHLRPLEPGSGRTFGKERE